MASFFARQIYKFTASKVPTSLLKWQHIHTVTVLLDADSPDAAEAEAQVRGLFGEALYALVPVHRRKPVRVRKETQVLLSLLPYNNWRSEYIVRRSRAEFKIGRVPLDVFDLVVSDPEGKSFSQSDVLTRIVEIIKDLK